MLLLVAPVLGYLLSAAPTAPAPPHRASRARRCLLQVTELDEESFAREIEQFEGLSVVKFYAPWCRTCRSIEPLYKRVAKERNAASPDRVKFYQVNFKDQKHLSLSQRVVQLPTIHFYSSKLGRVNRFTLYASSAGKTLAEQLDRYLGDTGHLELLQSMRSTAVSPLVQYVDLIGVMQALQDAPKYLQSEEGEKPPSSVVLDEISSAERQQQLDRLFDTIDLNSDGEIDASEIGAVGAAVGLFEQVGACVQGCMCIL